MQRAASERLADEAGSEAKTAHASAQRAPAHLTVGLWSQPGEECSKL